MAIYPWLFRLARNIAKPLPQRLKKYLTKISFVQKMSSRLHRRNPGPKIYDCKIAYRPTQKIKFCLDLSQNNQRRIYLKGIHEEATTRLLAKLINPAMTVVDIGAYIGYFTVLASLIVGHKGRVLAFEPAPDNFSQLKKTIQANGLNNVRLFPVALSDQKGTKPLRIATDPATHSLADSITSNFFTGRAKDTGKSISVIMTTLDHVLKREKISNIDIIKIDVEGAELNVLKGMNNSLLKNDNLKIICDVHETKLPAFGHSIKKFYNFLKKHNLTPYFITDKNLSKIKLTKNKPKDKEYAMFILKQKNEQPSSQA